MRKWGIILIIGGLILASVAGIWVFIHLSSISELSNGQHALPLSQRLLISGGTFIMIGAIPIMILALSFLTKNKPWYWSPFQSKQVSDICRHMTEDEKKIFKRRARIYGGCVGSTFGIAIGLVVTIQSWFVISIAIVLVIIYIVVTILWRKKLKSLLSSTEWAKSQGYTVDNIRL